MDVRRAISAVLLAVPLLCSCGGHPRIIPGAVLTDIYAEMLLADQWLADHSEARKASDTTLFYDPIFRRYGYTYEDYDATVRRYLQDPEKFAKVFKNASIKLKDERDRYRRKVEQLEDVREFNASIKGYSAKDFRKDTLMWRSLYKDSLLSADSSARDSLMNPESVTADTLKRDSLKSDALRPDVLKQDSLQPDTMRPGTMKRDSLRRSPSGRTPGVKKQILNKDEIHREVRV